MLKKRDFVEQIYSPDDLKKIGRPYLFTSCLVRKIFQVDQITILLMLLRQKIFRSKNILQQAFMHDEYAESTKCICLIIKKLPRVGQIASSHAHYKSVDWPTIAPTLDQLSLGTRKYFFIDQIDLAIENFKNALKPSKLNVIAVPDATKTLGP